MKIRNPKSEIRNKSSRRSGIPLSGQISNTKFKKLQQILHRMDRVLIAYSGGVDSTFLVKIAVDTLGRENVIAVTAKSQTYPAAELKDAKRLARSIGARHIIIWTKELQNKNFRSNPKIRCYYCKAELFKRLAEIAEKNNMKFILDGSNADDIKDFRPGTKALFEWGVRSPLKQAGITKEEVRAASKGLSLPTWDKPPMACLASRFPYGEQINIAKLARVEKAEAYLYRLGFKAVRVRSHGDIARIEVPKRQIPAIVGSRHALRLGGRRREKLLNKKALRDKIVHKLKKLGFIYITVDLQGYRTGSINEILSLASSK